MTPLKSVNLVDENSLKWFNQDIKKCLEKAHLYNRQIHQIVMLSKYDDKDFSNLSNHELKMTGDFLIIQLVPQDDYAQYILIESKNNLDSNFLITEEDLRFFANVNLLGMQLVSFTYTNRSSKEEKLVLLEIKTSRGTLVVTNNMNNRCYANFKFQLSALY